MNHIRKLFWFQAAGPLAQENCKVLVPTLRVGTHRLGRSASFGVEPTLLQHVTSPMDAERPTVRYDAERRNEGKIATLQFSCPLAQENCKVDFGKP